MLLILEKDIIQEIGIENLKAFHINESEQQWHDKVEIQLINFNKTKLKKLKELIAQTKELKEKSKALDLINNHLEMIDNPCGKIKTVEMGAPAMIGYVVMSAGYRIYIKNPNNQKYYAYRVSGIYYHPPSYHDRRHVSLEIVYDQFGKRETKSIGFYAEDLRGIDIIEAFDRKSIYIESDKFREKYDAEKSVFNEIHRNVGEQYILNGITTSDIPENTSRYSHRKFHSINHKAVIDIFIEHYQNEYADSKTSSEQDKVDLGLSFWKKQSKIYNKIFDKNKYEKQNKHVEIPVSSDVIIFDLKRHMRLVCHTDFLTPYQYIEDLEDSLIIPKENKQLIKNLLNSNNEQFHDIIRDKSGGLLVMLTGLPGVGKTLTAEVFAEIQKKPLYAVQSSQLGVEPVEIEKQLNLCFERSNRWNAVLLIDEADVYVHKRTTDLKQNSVVGTFLRVLEYYPNILFMTSNRADIIDDAIISRCIIVMEYPQPSSDEQKQIWNVLSKSLKCNITDDVITDIATKHDKLSGRDIKNILKLCKINNDNNPITPEIVNSLTKFIPQFKDVENSLKN